MAEWKQIVWSTEVILDSDISEAEGFMRKTGSGAYEAIKTNMGAAVAPTVNEDSGDGYAVGSRWLDTTADKEYVCLDATVGAAVWTETTGSGGMDNPATTNLDMAGYDVINCPEIQSNTDSGLLYLHGSNDHGAAIVAYGENHATFPGDVRLYVPNAAKDSWILGLIVNGVSDAPTVKIPYGLDMHQKEISAMAFENLASAPHSGTEVQGEAYYNTTDDHLHVWVV